MTSDERQPGALVPAESDIAFFGKITASVTHELNNVISIIDQTAGLLDDLIAGEERGVPISLDRLVTISASIQKQTQRGLGIVERLNRFAHSTDSARIEFDLNTTIGNLVELSRRPASLRKVHIEYVPSSSPIRMTGNPFALQQAVFGALQIALTACSPEVVVAVHTAAEGSCAIVVIEYPGDRDPLVERLDGLRSLLPALGGVLSISATPSGRELHLQFPARPSE